jgi:hypothetical protein
VQVAIDFDRGNIRPGGEQSCGQSAFAGADFDNVLVRLNIQSRNDSANDRRICQKVLPETLFGTMPQWKFKWNRLRHAQSFAWLRKSTEEASACDGYRIAG